VICEFDLQSLWTTEPVFKFEFIGSSGIPTSVEPTLLKASASVQPVFASLCCRLCSSVEQMLFKSVRRINR